MNIKVLGFSDPVSSWSHLLMALISFIGAYLLIKRGQGNTWRVFALSVYSFSLVFLFSMSGVFHLIDRSWAASGVLQRLDHAGIWILIAGTFTPIHAILFRGPLRWAVLLFIWTVSITGLVLEVIYFKSFPEWLALTFFIGMGWIGFLSNFKFKKIFPNHSPRLIIYGGACYTFGAILDFIRWPIFWPYVIGPHEVFHFFVMAGAICHWLFIYRWSSHPISDVFICNIKSYSDKLFYLEACNDHLFLSENSLSVIKQKAVEKIKLKYQQKHKYQILFRFFNEEIQEIDGGQRGN